jgi:hypothetical protein
MLPAFYIEVQATTLIRLIFLWLAASMFTISGILLRANYDANRSSFIHWYSLGLGLLAVGLMGVSLQAHVGSVGYWTSKCSQYLGVKI